MTESIHQAYRRHMLKTIEKHGYTKSTLGDLLKTTSRSALCRFFQEKDSNAMPVQRHSDIDWLWDVCDLIGVEPTVLIGWTPADPIEPEPEPEPEERANSDDQSPF